MVTMMHKLDVATFGYVSVSKAEFFETVGKLNVHPTIAGQTYHKVLGYKTLWQTPARQVCGFSIGGTHLQCCLK